jgi:hypothetical protein
VETAGHASASPRTTDKMGFFIASLLLHSTIAQTDVQVN